MFKKYWKVATIAMVLGTLQFASSAQRLRRFTEPRSTLSASSLQVFPVLQVNDNFLPNPVPVPDFPGGVDWINTSSRLQLSDLRGKLVLLDFWTYCCINCMHVLPVLKQAEEKYDSKLVVVGVHTPKFETERDTQNVRDAILRYEIKHPVINDSEHILWKRLGIASWPTLVLIDPDGNAIWANAGEIAFEDLDRVLKRAVDLYQAKGRIDSRRVRFELAADSQPATPLQFPGKIAVDAPGRRLAISDSNHNRIVISDTSGNLLATIGSGNVGKQDGEFANATFNHPQGVAFHGEIVFVADTENHLIRKIDLKSKKVSTIAGTGRQTRNPWQWIDQTLPLTTQSLQRVPLQTDLGSPWDVLVHDDTLFIAMAGPHQIWKMDVEGTSLSIFAGSGREDIVDGQLLPRTPYSSRSSAFAQPSGLATDGQRLFVADSEGSSIRTVPFDPTGNVGTLIGTAELYQARLFTFGSTDGPFDKVLMQHPLGVAFTTGNLYVADTYNNKIRHVDLVARHVRTLVGDGIGGRSDNPARLDEPGGLCVADNQLYIADTNNHSIRVFDLSKKSLTTLTISGLQPPATLKTAPETQRASPKLPSGARRRTGNPIELAKDQAELEIEVNFGLPSGWKMNELAPLGYVALWSDQSGKATLAESSSGKFEKPAARVAAKIPVPSANKMTLELALIYYFCRTDGKGLCLADGVVIEIPVARGNTNARGVVKIQQPIEALK